MLSFLDLVALGTVCDVMPIIGLNRVMVRSGLMYLKQRKNVGLAALCDIIGLDKIDDTYHLGFIIGPRINACGRVGDVNIGNQLLCCEDPIEARILAEKLNNFNLERQVIENQLYTQALEKISKNENNSFIFVVGKNWHEGIVGIIASRLKEKYNLPTFIGSIHNNEIKVSCRSISPEIDLGSAIIEAKQLGLLISGGGHAMAGGFTLNIDRLNDLKKFLENKLTNKIQTYLKNNKTLSADLVLECDDISLELVKNIEAIGPYGVDNPKPKIILKNTIIVNTKPFGKNSEHLRSVAISAHNNKYQNNTVTLVTFNANRNEALYKFLTQQKKPCDLLGTVSLNKWMALETIQFILEDILI